MPCRNCSADNPDGSAFCQNCGQRLGIVCDACGRGCVATARFCGWCGGSLTQGKLVVEPGGERKQATVLFADIVGSTALIVGLDAEQAMDRLQPVVAAMSRAVRRFDGTILRTLGDGLKAAFGAPLAREGHALLACQAALAMRDAVAGLDGAPQIRVGLHSGEVVAGALDTGSSVELEAQGMTVHLASRIEQLAAPGEIALSGECRALIGAYCETEALGPSDVKGLDSAVALFRLVGLRPAVASEQFRGGDLAPFLGRQAELTVLQDALLAAENGVASVIGIAAPAGVGKSRLCFEFGEWCRQRRVDVVEGRAHLFGQATPLLPVLEMLRTFLRVTPRLGTRAARDRVAQSLAALGLDMAADLPILLEFLGIPAADLIAPRLDPAGRSARLQAIVRSLIVAAGQRTSVIIVEDMHWLDPASEAFMQTLVEAVEGTRTVVVFNFRPVWHAVPRDCPYYRELLLAELPDATVGEMVRDLLGDDPALQAIVAHVAMQSGGNPFFAEQLVLSLVQSGVLVGQRGRYRAIGPAIRDLPLPATVEAVIGARLDSLGEREKTLLQIGAIVGKEFPQVLVAEVAGIPMGQAHDLLARLCDAALIQPQSLAGGPGFAFRHPLIQEVSYNTQLRTRRIRLHAAVAGAMGRQEWGLHDECAGLLAYHCEAAGQTLAAATHLGRAARWVGRTNATQAVAHWKKMHFLLHPEPASAEVDRLRALASGQIVSFGWREGMTAEEASPYAEEALRFARRPEEHSLHEPLLLASYGRILAASGATDDYVRLVQAALAVADVGGDPVHLGTVNVMLSQAYWLSGRLPEAIAANDAALAAFARADNRSEEPGPGLTVNQVFGFDVRHWAECLRSRILVWLGRSDEALECIDRVSRADPEIVDLVVQFIPHCAAVELAWHRGDTALAQTHAAIVAAFAERSGTRYLHVMAQACLGLAAATAGENAVAERYLTEAVTAARAGKAALEFEARLLAHLAGIHQRAGQPERAAGVAAEAMAVARRRTDRLGEYHASAVALAAGLNGDRTLAERNRELLALTGSLAIESTSTRPAAAVATSTTVKG